jgi:PAS domain S-box-containing protein
VTGLSSEAFAHFFERFPFALVIRSLETEAFLAVNAAYEDLTGYTRDESVGRTPGELGIFDPIHHHELNVQKVARDGSGVEVTFSSVRMILDGKLVAASIIRERK